MGFLHVAPQQLGKQAAGGGSVLPQPRDICVCLCYVLSAGWCIAVLWYLLRRAQGSRSLLWVQLALLLAYDGAYSLLTVAFYLLYVSNSMRHTMKSCLTEESARVFLEMASSMLEAQIALGFAAACGRTSAPPVRLFALAWLTPLMSGALLLTDRPQLDLLADPPYYAMERCRYRGHNTIWDGVIVSSIALCAVSYILALKRTRNLPSSMRSLVLFRALLYAVNFVITYWAYPVVGFIEWRQDQQHIGFTDCMSIFFELCCQVLLGLNGFLNSVTYVLWIRWRLRAMRRALNTEGAPDHISAIEQHAMLDGFELYASDDSTDVGTRASLADSVAVGRDLRHGVSSTSCSKYDTALGGTGCPSSFFQDARER